MSSGNRTDISLEDPDFWQKWAKKAELDLDAINGRVSPVPEHSCIKNPHCRRPDGFWELEFGWGLIYSCLPA